MRRYGFGRELDRQSLHRLAVPVVVILVVVLLVLWYILFVSELQVPWIGREGKGARRRCGGVRRLGCVYGVEVKVEVEVMVDIGGEGEGESSEMVGPLLHTPSQLHVP